LDGTDPQRNISFEFVSEKDIDAWEMGRSNSGTVGAIAIEPVAEGLQKGFSKTDTGQVLGAFYDPVSYYSYRNQTDPSASGNIKEVKEKSIQELQAQVKDFIAWLKNQGII
jgi:hypothetical protein